jgi:hypothetical protein
LISNVRRRRSEERVAGRISPSTNPLPGEKEKYATTQTVTYIQYVESNGTVATQPFVMQLSQAQAIVTAAEKVYCPA